jgi:hypothetical protein
MPTEIAVILAAVAPAHSRSASSAATASEMIQRVVTGSSRRGTGADADQGTEHHDRGGAAIGMLPSIWNERRGRDEIDQEQQRRDQARRGDAARQGHEDQRRAEAGKSTRRSRNKGDCANCDSDFEADVRRDKTQRTHPLFVWSMM